MAESGCRTPLPVTRPESEVCYGKTFEVMVGVVDLDQAETGARPAIASTPEQRKLGTASSGFEFGPRSGPSGSGPRKSTQKPKPGIVSPQTISRRQLGAWSINQLSNS